MEQSPQPLYPSSTLQNGEPTEYIEDGLETNFSTKPGPGTNSSSNSNETTQHETLVQTIRQWVQNDRDMNLLKQELAKRRESQKKITAKLVELMRENEMEEADIMYVQETKKKSISKKGLIPILYRFYKGDSTKAAELTQFIYDNRETVVQEKIKPKPMGKKGG